jgi:TatA/E family protein of Tat protein translocase
MPFPNIGAPELIIILIIALVVLGPGKLPDVASSLGKSVREFSKAATDVSDAGKLTPPPQAVSAGPAAAAPAAPAANTLSTASEPNTLNPAAPASDLDKS